MIDMIDMIVADVEIVKRNKTTNCVVMEANRKISETFFSSSSYAQMALQGIPMRY